MKSSKGESKNKKNHDTKVIDMEKTTNIGTQNDVEDVSDIDEIDNIDSVVEDEETDNADSDDVKENVDSVIDTEIDVNSDDVVDTKVDSVQDIDNDKDNDNDNESIKSNLNKNTNNSNGNKIVIIMLSILLGLLIIISILLVVNVVNDKDTGKDKNEENSVVEKDKNNGVEKEAVDSEEKVEKEPFDFDESDKGKEISITDSEVVRLFNLVSADLNQYDIFKSKQTLVSELTPDVRARLARNLYRDKLVSVGGNVYFHNGKQYVNNEKFEVDEQHVINAYNSLFGEGYYSTEYVAYCNILCCEMKYDAASKKYTGYQDACGVVASEYEYYEFEELIKAVEYSDRLELTVSVLYPYVGFYENNFRFYYRDYERTIKLPLDNVSYEEARSYQKTNADSLEQFTYVFKLNNNQYNYYGVYKTKN